MGYPPDPHWRDTLVGLLQKPTPTLTMSGAIAWRLHRTYLWIFGAILLIWVVKIDLTRGIASPLDLIVHAGVGSVPGWLVVVVVAVAYVVLFTLGLTARHRYRLPDPEFQRLIGEEPD